MALNAMTTPKTYIQEQQKIWSARRDLIYKGLCDLGFNLWKPEGAFYVFPEFENPVKLVWDLYTKYKVIIYLGDWFGSPDRIRLSYALDSKEIEEGLNRIESALKNEKY
jgi:aspartate/methionine/tyrosine aminotransferase